MNKKKIGIWGLGIVGKTAIPYFATQGSHIQVMDRRMPTPEEEKLLQLYNAQFVPEDQKDQFLEANDSILASCTIDLRPYAQHQNKWLSELDLFAAGCTKPIIAITGSVGKTTITHLLSQLLLAQGKKVFTGGNIGIGLLDQIDIANQADYIILEVSSFQLELCSSFKPFLALYTNIYANHLDRHGTFNEYLNAKLKQIQNQATADQVLLPLSMFDKIPQKILESRPFAFFHVGHHVQNHPEVLTKVGLGDFHTLYFLHNNSIFMYYQTSLTKIIDLDGESTITYQENILMLAAALHMLGCALENFSAAISGQNLPSHRMEKVATINGVDFYNDSKSTLAESTLAAVQKIHGRPIVLLLGGISKGVDRNDLIAQLAGKVRLIICFGKEAALLHTYCNSHKIPAHSFDNLDAAFDSLLTLLQSSDQVLFSPAGASYDLFKDYQERGDYFKKLVMSFKDKI